MSATTPVHLVQVNSSIIAFPVHLEQLNSLKVLLRTLSIAGFLVLRGSILTDKIASVSPLS